jgi:Ran-binding protein 3
MANTRIDRFPLVPAFRPPLFDHQESPKKGRLFGPGSLGKTTEEEQQDSGPPETTSHPSGPESVPVIVEETSGDEHKMVISVNGSPPHETKMRQISEGVHGIEMKKKDQGDDGRVVASTPFPTTENASDEDESVDLEEFSPLTTNPAVPDLPKPDTSASVSASSAVNDAPTSFDRPKRASVDYLLPLPSTRRGSDSSGEQGLKRKLGDRAVSESREAESLGKKAPKKDVTDAATTCGIGTKRSREDEKDPNPKEAKRPSPPPDKTSKTEVEKPPAASPSKVVGVRILDSGEPAG